MAVCNCWWAAWSLEPMAENPTPAAAATPPAAINDLPMSLPCLEMLSRAVSTPSRASPNGPRTPVRLRVDSTPPNASRMPRAALLPLSPASLNDLARPDRSPRIRTTTDGPATVLPPGRDPGRGRLEAHAAHQGVEHQVGQVVDLGRGHVVEGANGGDGVGDLPLVGSTSSMATSMS